MAPERSGVAPGSVRCHRAANNGEPMSDAYGVRGSYDAFYLVAYALVASAGSEPTGTLIAQGLQRTVGGVDIPAGPSDVGKAIAELLEGGRIDYDGVTGRLDFDVKTGESPGNYSLYCVSSTEFVLPGQYYNSDSAEWEGDFGPCP